VTSSAIGLEDFHDATSVTSHRHFAARRLDTLTFCDTINNRAKQLNGKGGTVGLWHLYIVIPGFDTERQNGSLCLCVIKQILADTVWPRGWGHCASAVIKFLPGT